MSTPPSKKQVERLEKAIAYLFDKLPEPLLEAYLQTKTSVDAENQKAGKLASGIREQVANLLFSDENLGQGALEKRVYREVSKRAAEEVVDALVASDILYVSRKAWQPYRRLQTEWMKALENKSPTFTDDFQFQINGYLAPHRQTLKLIRKESLMDLVTDRKSRGQPVSLKDFVIVFGDAKN
jgi:hypothetical protein